MPSKKNAKKTKPHHRISTALAAKRKAQPWSRDVMMLKVDVPINFVRTGILTGLEYACAILEKHMGELVAEGAQLQALAKLTAARAAISLKACEIRNV